MIDSKSCTIDYLLKNLVTKHINIRLHFVRHVIELRDVRIDKIVSKENSINVFMKYHD